MRDAGFADELMRRAIKEALIKHKFGHRQFNSTLAPLTFDFSSAEMSASTSSAVL